MSDKSNETNNTTEEHSAPVWPEGWIKIGSGYIVYEESELTVRNNSHEWGSSERVELDESHKRELVRLVAADLPEGDAILKALNKDAS